MGAHRRRAAAGYAAHVQRQPAPVRLYEDSDDDGLYRCVGTTWTLIADDGDGDGFASSIDADDADDAVYARNLTAAVVKSWRGDRAERGCDIDGDAAV